MMKKEIDLKTREKAYWEFHLRVGTDKPAMPTKEMLQKLSQKINEIPEVVSLTLEEKYA